MLYNVAWTVLKAYEACCDAGVPVSYDVEVGVSRYPTQHQFGICRRRGNSYHILVSPALLSQDVPYIALKSTVMHELLHTCADTDGHDAKWQEYAKAVEPHGYRIMRVASVSDYGMSDEDYAKVCIQTRDEGAYLAMPSFYVPLLICACEEDGGMVRDAREVLSAHGFSD